MNFASLEIILLFIIRWTHRIQKTIVWHFVFSPYLCNHVYVSWSSKSSLCILSLYVNKNYLTKAETNKEHTTTTESISKLRKFLPMSDILYRSKHFKCTKFNNKHWRQKENIYIWALSTYLTFFTLNILLLVHASNHVQIHLHSFHGFRSK